MKKSYNQLSNFFDKYFFKIEIIENFYLDYSVLYDNIFKKNVIQILSLLDFIPFHLKNFKI
jgi:hypothetical protein